MENPIVVAVLAFLGGVGVAAINAALSKAVLKKKPSALASFFAVRQIIENYSDPYYDFSSTLSHIPYHPDYFRRVFMTDMGCTPVQYLTRQRIQNAKKLLVLRKQTRLSIREIAWLSGFRDNLYFSRVFREQVGMSPTEYVQSVSAKK